MSNSNTTTTCNKLLPKEVEVKDDEGVLVFARAALKGAPDQLIASFRYVNLSYLNEDDKADVPNYAWQLDQLDPNYPSPFEDITDNSVLSIKFNHYGHLCELVNCKARLGEGGREWTGYADDLIVLCGADE